MNLPNKLTVLRVIMIPLFLALFFCGQLLPAFLVFALASLTDMLDGMIARKYNLVTDFGKLMDPLADKLLTISAFICLLGGAPENPAQGFLMYQGWWRLLVLVLIVFREFVVTSIRLVAAEKGVVIAADKWGKLKTVAQMVWVCQELLLRSFHGLPLGVAAAWQYAGGVLLLVMLLLTVGSGVNYAVKNRGMFADR